MVSFMINIIMYLIFLRRNRDRFDKGIYFLTEKNEYVTKTTSTLVITIGGLLKYTNYSIFVRAFTKPGDGVKSNPVYCRTEEDGKIL